MRTVELQPLSASGGSPRGETSPLSDTVTLAKLPVPPRVPPLLNLCGLGQHTGHGQRALSLTVVGPRVGVGSCDGKHTVADLLQAAGTGKGAPEGEGIAIGVQNGIVPGRARRGRWARLPYWTIRLGDVPPLRSRRWTRPEPVLESNAGKSQQAAVEIVGSGDGGGLGEDKTRQGNSTPDWWRGGHSDRVVDRY